MTLSIKNLVAYSGTFVLLALGCGSFEPDPTEESSNQETLGQLHEELGGKAEYPCAANQMFDARSTYAFATPADYTSGPCDTAYALEIRNLPAGNTPFKIKLTPSPQLPADTFDPALCAQYSATTSVYQLDRRGAIAGTKLTQSRNGSVVTDKPLFPGDPVTYHCELDQNISRTSSGTYRVDVTASWPMPAGGVSHSAYVQWQ